ncbi:class I adenylate-forming enzyme family protein [Peristeroidobacter soli]|jgi:acyl-CoA synthetase (AMP-forming)/AMP-acid ligase II|uniref:class I adenylate-forming enzyme family protein n=1 Tax=Peristeroidobacter soli TaxID=2497877 RepID=UPI00101D26E9|nr:class I adenylate-forming enzyme family protein [Peristeroidobacter soli]
MSTHEYGSEPRLDAILARAAVSEPGRTAVIFQGKAWSYAEVHDRARRLAGALAGLGIVKGDRVALWIGNRAEFVEIIFGVPMLGAMASPLDHWWTWKDAYAALEQIRPKVLIVGPSQAAAVAGQGEALQAAGIERVFCLEECPPEKMFHSYAELVASASKLRSLTPVVPSDPAVVFFTSGSTGRSKGAVHTHGSLLAAASTAALEFDLHDGERTLHFLPLFSSCMEHLLPLTLRRATHVIMPHFDAAAVWEAIEAYQITHFDAVPTTLRRILDAAPARIPTSLRSITYASERMPEPLITALIERMPNVGFVQFYGMMEQLCLTVCSPADQLRKIGTVGRPMLGAQIVLLNSDGEPVGPGESGEIVARSLTVFAGYWQDGAATHQILTSKGMRTGDLGRFDQDGFLVLDGRVKEMIKTGGLTVIPNEVEGILLGHPAVKEAAVIGVPDERWGEAVHAVVTLAPGTALLEADLKQFCQERLTGYKRPKEFHIVADLPRTGIGKIARRLVRERVMASLPK